MKSARGRCSASGNRGTRTSLCSGFTLLEVMLAFVLLATAMGLLIAMLSNGLRQVRQAQGETEATLYAQSLLDQIGVLEAIVPGRRAGEFDQGRYRYEIEVTEVDDPAPLPETSIAPAPAATTIGAPKLYRVALAVSWGANQPAVASGILPRATLAHPWAAQQLHFVTLRARSPGPGGLLPK